MEIAQILEHLHQRIRLISLYQRSAKELAEAECRRLLEIERRLQTSPELADLTISTQNMHYINPVDGSRIFYGWADSTIDDLLKATRLHQNRQYQWLLAEAYEEFEDFLEMAFANAGMNDRTFWQLADYGNISLSEIDDKGWDWHLRQAQNKKGSPESLLNHFRARLPRFAELERSNKLGVDLRIYVALVAQLRHHIVHTGGRVKDREAFIRKVLSSVGQYNNGKPTKENRDLIDDYFFDGEHSDTIGLLEIRTHEQSRLPLQFSMFDGLCRPLLATAYALASAIQELQGKSPPTRTEH